MYGYIYLTTNKVNNKKYIGQHAGSEFDKNYYGSGTAFTLALNKYGKDNFEREILAWAKTKEELDQLEIDWIAKSNAVESEEYYNIAPGGEGGPILTGEDNPMYGKGHLIAGERNPRYGKGYLYTGANNPNYGNHKLAGENHPMYGKHLSEETIKKISEAHKRENLSEDTIKKMSEAHKRENLSEDTIKKMSDWAKTRTGKLNPNYGNHKLAGKNNIMYGKHHSEETKRKMRENHYNCSGKNNPTYGAKHPHHKSVLQFDLDMNLVAEWESLCQAEKAGVGYKQGITGACKNNRVYRGFYWKYKEDTQ